MLEKILPSPLIQMETGTFPTTTKLVPTSSMRRIKLVLGSPFPLTQQGLWELTLLSPSIPTMQSTFPTMITPIATSSTPLVQAVAQSQAIGTMSPLTQQGLWELTLLSPSIPTMQSTFPTMITPIATSSTPPVQVVAQPQATGTMFPLKQQVSWDLSLLSPSIPMMQSTFPTMIPPIGISSTPPVQVVAQPQAIGSLLRLKRQVLWDITLQSPSIQPMQSTFPTSIIPMMTSSTPHVQAVAQQQAIGSMSPLT